MSGFLVTMKNLVSKLINMEWKTNFTDKYLVINIDMLDT